MASNSSSFRAFVVYFPRRARILGRAARRHVARAGVGCDRGAAADLPRVDAPRCVGARRARGERSRARAVAARARSSTSFASVVGLGSWRRTSRAPSPPALVPRAAHGASVPTPRPAARASRRHPARDPRARAARPSSAPDGTPDPAEEHGTAIHPDADARDADVQDASARDDAEDAEEAEGDEEDEDEFEYEEVEVEVEVDYTPLDHARDAVESLGTWRDVASWPRNSDATDATNATHATDATDAADAAVPPAPETDAAAFAASAVAPIRRRRRAVFRWRPRPDSPSRSRSSSALSSAATPPRNAPERLLASSRSSSLARAAVAAVRASA